MSHPIYFANLRPRGILVVVFVLAMGTTWAPKVLLLPSHTPGKAPSLPPTLTPSCSRSSFLPSTGRCSEADAAQGKGEKAQCPTSGGPRQPIHFLPSWFFKQHPGPRTPGRSLPKTLRPSASRDPVGPVTVQLDTEPRNANGVFPHNERTFGEEVGQDRCFQFEPQGTHLISQCESEKKVQSSRRP